MKNSGFSKFLFSVLIVGAVRSCAAQTFDTAPWREDFGQLKKEMSAHYANLEWGVEHRHMDLKSLSDSVGAQLGRAGNEGGARKVFERFLDTFGDGHLWIEWPAADRREQNDDTSVTTRIGLRERLGYRVHKVKPGIVFSSLSAYAPVSTPDSGYFPAGTLRLRDGRRLGILRIAIFTEHNFPDLCETVLKHLGLTDSSVCQSGCEDLVERRTADLLTAALERQLVALNNENIAALIVDITGNGGGSNWVEPAARVLTKKRLRSPRTEFIRHRHWVEELKEELQTVLADSGKTPSHNKNLDKATALLRRAITEAEKPCDISMIWEDRTPPCSLVVTEPVLYPDCILPYAKPGSLPDRPSSFILFYPSRYRYHEHVYSGRLIVLVDHSTASSAEYFAAMLQDNDAAKIMGEPTFGAGGGFTNGGIPVKLKNSGGQVKMPDCVRLRGDGSNEMEGITPDFPVQWHRSDNDYMRAERVYELLSQLFRPILSR